jgi:AraC-like DNA-binding protein
MQSSHTGVRAITHHRHAIGFLLKGRKFLYDGDARQEINTGDLFYLGIGTHYVEDMPDENRPFEQIVFYYDTPQLHRVLNHLGQDYQIPMRNDHDCPRCHGRQNVIYPAWSFVKQFFQTINQYLKENLFDTDPQAADLALTQLVFLLIRNEACCLNPRIFDSIDAESAEFERIVRKHIFDDISIEELALECNRSLTAFKKDFKRHFYDSPHRWYVRQRLMQASMLLTFTGKSIAQIGRDCTFPNTSHFIKLFRKEFGDTPVGYRQREKKHDEDPKPAVRKRAKTKIKS